MIWPILAILAHAYYIDDFKRTMHHRMMKQRAKESLEFQESTDYTL